MAEDEQALPGIDIRRPNMARMYNYALGGKDNFASDREAVQNLFRLAPENAYVPKANRQFLGTAVRFAAEQGIAQFLDLGAGLPSQGSTHEVARLAQPDARVVYVDSDPVVLAHARALLVGNDSGLAVIDEDIRDTGRILEHPQTRRLIDFSQPAAVLFVAVLHGIPDADDPAGIVARLVGELPPGSWLAIAHPASDVARDKVATMTDRYNQRVTTAATLRTHAEISAFFAGTELLPPGVVQYHQWHPGEPARDAEGEVAAYCGLGRKL